MKDIEVWLGSGAPSEQRDEIGELFGEVGVPVKVRSHGVSPVGDGAGFTVEVFLLNYALKPFLVAFFGGAGLAAWKQIEGLLEKLKRNHQKHFPSEAPMDEGLLIIKDVERRIQVGIKTDMPDEALGKLAELDIGDQEQVSYNWNDQTNEWEATDLSEYEDWSPRTRDDLRFRLRRLRRRIFPQ